ncbi:MAG TPA: PhzF family phenazine biosynthesis protein [Ilumatobacteraceae bacterium]|nr:PhzF family phenazine biosynthesis protein [Ilumatobacteraceae bacterium]
MRHRFSQVDVFADGGFAGNPVAVVHDAAGITTDEMLAITSWTNLSETTFLVAPTTPEADYRVRIFCPGRELPFAGHPTLGSCAAWLAAGGQPRDPDRIVQECDAGLVPVRRDGERLAFAAPRLIRSGPVTTDELDDRLDVLGLTPDDVVDAAWVDNGPGWMGLLLESADAVLSVPRPTGTRPTFDVGLVGLFPPGSEFAVEVRAFFADGSGAIREDPVTGSLNASVAQWLTANGRLTTPYVARQGTALDRAGRVHVDAADGALWIGGATTVTITGTIGT